jgi:cyclopropane fatty-acyl-phospholipid synthase-like methyltransferase
MGEAKRLLDVGGGSGAYSMCLARANPELVCTVLDGPEVCRIADELISREGLQDRVRTLPGSYHEVDFPACDALHVFGVLHLEPESGIRKILKRSFDALEDGGTIRVLDMMTDKTRSRPTYSSLFALKMALFTADGWVFSDEDLKGWLADAGFVDITVEELPPLPHWLATARKP